MMNRTADEVNFDGLVGPTHHYAGLASGNLASAAHRHETSQPRTAALQGLRKMAWVRAQGVAQAVLPPLPRPDLRLLHELGFRGSEAHIVESAWRADPWLLAAAYSASNMWTANAATASPSADCHDQRLHLSPANLMTGLHRSRESLGTHRLLQYLFADSSHFAVHAPLPSAWPLADEGAANHTRLCVEFGSPGLELFVYGRDGQQATQVLTHYPARQTLQASQAIARRHQLPVSQAAFLQQSETALNAGVFHNDVIAVGHQRLLLYHEDAFVGGVAAVQPVQEAFQALTGESLGTRCILRSELPLERAVSSYLFNSQLLSLASDRTLLLAPRECEEDPLTQQLIARLLDEDNPLVQVHFVDLKQSMQNGGGPACLRLRMVMTRAEQAAMHQGVLLDDALIHALEQWIEQHYREELPFDDLRDPQLIEESRAASASLARLLKLPEQLLLESAG